MHVPCVHVIKHLSPACTRRLMSDDVRTLNVKYALAVIDRGLDPRGRPLDSLTCENQKSQAGRVRQNYSGQDVTPFAEALHDRISTRNEILFVCVSHNRPFMCYIAQTHLAVCWLHASKCFSSSLPSYFFRVLSMTRELDFHMWKLYSIFCCPGHS
jgi:hypothetical protein